jgi:hypothetical protein
VQTELTDLIGGAPGALDTLNELAAAINDDASFASTVTSSLGTKAPIANPTFTGSITIGSAGISESELEILDGATLSTTELNKLDGVTSSTAELNILDGVTSSTAELNILDGVTASTSELNKMDGVTATTTELNYTDGVTSNIQTQLNAIGLASWPINSIYTSISSTNPNSLFGGTWVAFGAGRVLVGRDSSDSDFITSEETGGSKTDSHTLTTAEMPSHQHGTNIRNEYNDVHPNTSGTSWSSGKQNDGVTAGGGYTGLTDAAGSGNAHTHDIVQPYIVVHFFKRTA